MANAPQIPKIPPLRMDIQEPQQSSAVNRPPAQGASSGANTASNGSAPQHRTSKAWYYYWSKVGEQVVTNTQTLNGLVTYGTHANRPDPSTMPDGAIAVESDRGVIYQNELIQGAQTWRYIAGAMWGTLSPDQRPTDLGVNDSGFEFRSTDQPPREFIWSGGYWVETTPNRYDTHAKRLAQPVANLWQGALWVETDRGNVVYQLQGTAWHFLAGSMRGTISPDQRPTDLGANDAGFRYIATDTLNEYVWSGSAWTDLTPPSGLLLYATASASLTLTTTATTIPGLTLTLPRAGRYLVHGVVQIAAASNPAGDAAQAAYGQAVNGAGAAIGTQMIFYPFVFTGTGLTGSPIGLNFLMSQQWSYLASGPDSVSLQSWKSGGTGGTTAGTESTFSAHWISAT